MNDRRARRGTGLMAVIAVIASLCTACTSNDSQPGPEPAKQENSAPELALISLRCEKNLFSTFAIGEIRNISNSPLHDVQALAEFRSESGELIQTSQALVDENSIMPGHAATFSVPQPNQAEIKKCAVKFDFLVGDRAGEDIAFLDKNSRNPAQVRDIERRR